MKHALISTNIIINTAYLQMCTTTCRIPYSLGARRDSDGYLWITGRIDDKLNISGHLMSTAEVESCLTEHHAVSEAAVVSRPHPVKGECLYCFVTPNSSCEFTPKLVKELCSQGIIVKRNIKKLFVTLRRLRELVKFSFTVKTAFYSDFPVNR